VGEVQKSVNPIVYKSASVRNLPVPVQSLLQLLSSMDSEEPPFETPQEKNYNRVLGELARTKLECSARLAKLGEEASVLASQIGDSSSSGGDHVDALNTTGVLSGSDPASVVISGNATATTNVTDGVANTTHPGAPSGIPGFNRSLYEDPSFNQTPVGCPPCPRVPCVGCRPTSDDCGPSSTSGGDLDTTDSPSTLLATPEAVLVGAAAALLVLLLAAAVGLFLRYVPILISGLLILVLVAVVWYFSSKYPGAAKRLGARIWSALRSGVSAVVDRLLGRHHPEVRSSCIS
jgi:hypothetical protein